MRFLQAKEQDKEKIMSLYKEAVGSEGCTWSEEYPNEEILEGDLKRGALFCLKDEKGEVLGAVSLDEDEAVDALKNWSFCKENGKRATEIARLVIKEGYRGQKLAGKMLGCLLEWLKANDYEIVYFLVAKKNERARKAYQRFAFMERGEAEIFGEQWLCYEKKLK